MTIDEWKCVKCRELQLLHLVDVPRYCETGRMTIVRYTKSEIAFNSTCPWMEVMSARREGARTYGTLMHKRPELRAWLERVQREENDDERPI